MLFKLSYVTFKLSPTLYLQYTSWVQ